MFASQILLFKMILKQSQRWTEPTNTAMLGCVAAVLNLILFLLFKRFYVFSKHFIGYPCFPLKWSVVRCPYVRVFDLTCIDDLLHGALKSYFLKNLVNAGASCSIYGCGTSRKHSGICIFRIPAKYDNLSTNTREACVHILTRDGR